MGVAQRFAQMSQFREEWHI